MQFHFRQAIHIKYIYIISKHITLDSHCEEISVQQASITWWLTKWIKSAQEANHPPNKTPVNMIVSLYISVEIRHVAWSKLWFNSLHTQTYLHKYEATDSNFFNFFNYFKIEINFRWRCQIFCISTFFIVFFFKLFLNLIIQWLRIFLLFVFCSSLTFLGLNLIPLKNEVWVRKSCFCAKGHKTSLFWK